MRLLFFHDSSDPNKSQKSSSIFSGWSCWSHPAAQTHTVEHFEALAGLQGTVCFSGLHTHHFWLFQKPALRQLCVLLCVLDEAERYRVTVRVIFLAARWCQRRRGFLWSSGHDVPYAFYLFLRLIPSLKMM